MSGIPPNGAVSVTIRVFDGGNQVVQEKTENVPCESVNQAKVIAQEIAANVERIEKAYQEKT